MFASREDAGLKLGRSLQDQEVRADLVLGLPRGGVVVAAAVAHILRLPLDVLIVRKIGHPRHREFAVGALAEHGVTVLDEGAIEANAVIREELEAVIQEEKDRLESYEVRFHPRGAPALASKAVLLVDDGIATGATTEAAVLSVRKQGAGTIVVAAPVASTSAVQRLTRVADEVRVLCVDPAFDAVGRYYDVFDQTTDEEVLELLRRGRGVRRET
ncbi:MAG: phosphoribosyltransferase [Limisphaerales bacterium]